jgi:MarR family transcriptional regulator, organic hydroperoxide resistance regulator
MAHLAGLGLTASEINVLGNLAGRGAPTASALAASTGTRPTTLTSVLDRLEGRGYLTRQARPGDRRSVLIELTADGQQAASAVRHALGELEARALAGLPQAAADGFATVLAALAGEAG